LTDALARMSTIDAMADLIRQNSPVLLLTGAGISTDSGIPAYRNARGEWSHPPPVQARAFYTEAETRRRYWARSMAGWPRIAKARPNAAHQACAALQQMGITVGLITQNVDGLHQRAGSQHVTDLHGNLDTVRCIACQQTQSRQQMQDRLLALNPACLPSDAPAGPDGDSPIETTDGFHVPDCEHCGGILKPDVVFFGENVPAHRVEHCFEQLSRCRLLLCIGSSLMVFSGFRFCRTAHEKQIPVAIINRGTTRADDLATVKLELDCASALSGIQEILWQNQAAT
jgi:NAD-dependent SIR2 family protein deacetylase